jgi:hypothetical protein
MKLVCECGKEIGIKNPPEFMEITRFVLRHGHVPPPRRPPLAGLICSSKDCPMAHGWNRTPPAKPCNRLE